MMGNSSFVSSGRASRLLAVAFVTAGLVLALASAAVVSRASAGDSSGIVHLSTWRPSVVAPGQKAVSTPALVPDPSRRQLFTIQTSNPVGWLAVYDLDTLAPLAAGLQTTIAPGGPYAIDPRDGGLLAAVNTTTAPEIDLFQLRDGALRPAKAITLTNPSLTGDFVAGITVEPGGTLMAVATGAPFAGLGTSLENAPGSLSVSLVDISDLSRGAASVLWTQPVPQCTRGMDSTRGLALGLVTQTNSLYMGCTGPDTATLNRPPGPEGVGQLVLKADPRSGADHFVMQPYPADFSGVADSEFDPLTGRYIVQWYLAGNGGTDIAAFDAASGAWAGAVRAGQNETKAATLDPATGRLYAWVNDASAGYAILAAEGRTTPLGQGRVHKWGGAAPGNPIAVDPKTHRFFIPITTYVEVFQDAATPLQSPSLTQADSNTQDVPLVAGQADMTYAGSTQGYGAVYRFVGGPANVFLSFSPVTTAPPAGSGTREVDLSWLDSLALSKGEASAGAITAQGDADATQPEAGSNWPYTLAHCADLSGAAQTATEGTTTVSCDAAKNAVRATSQAGGSSGNGVGVGSTSLDSQLSLDPKAGIVATVTSTASGISVASVPGGPPVLSIGEVTVVSTAQAYGVPGSARTSFTRTVQNVVLNGTTLCTTQCDLNQVASQVDGQYPATLRLSFPEPDADLARGTPGGYEALVRRNAAEEVQQVSLNEQQPSRVEVPGMEIEIDHENSSPSRTLVDLAGTEAEARLGRFSLGGFLLTSPTDAGAGLTSSDVTTPGNDYPGNPGTGPGIGHPRQPVQPPLRRLINNVLGPLFGLLANNPGLALRLFAVWAILLAPVYLSARRWLLLQRYQLIQGGTA